MKRFLGFFAVVIRVTPLCAVMICLTSLFAGCEKVDDDIEKHKGGDPEIVLLSDVAEMISELPVGADQVAEVNDAVNSSLGNGYDQEYTMERLLSCPGCGVGDSETKAGKSYERPMMSLIRDYLSKKYLTKAGETDLEAVEEYVGALSESDVQIYWPYSETWDGSSLPIVTFDPGDGSQTNVGYKITVSEQGERSVQEIVVDESVAAERPVWVVNRNDDSGHPTIEMLRREDPSWGTGGGSLVVNALSLPCSLACSGSVSGSGGPSCPGSVSGSGCLSCPDCFSIAGSQNGPEGLSSEPNSEDPLIMLVLKSLKMNRNYDSWFAGASEFFIKCGSVEDFTASTEAELKLFTPAVTDLMVVVRRNRRGVDVPLNVVLVSDWTSQLESCAFMINEDDGGVQTKWACSATVKIKSRSYGFDISIPLNVRDDIVWRGQLSRKYFEKFNNVSGRFGGVNLTFGIVTK